MKTLLAWIGGFTVMLAVASSLGIGHFRYIYGPDKITCTSDFPQNPLNPTKENHVYRLRQD